MHVQPVSKRATDNIPQPIRMIIFFASNPEVELSSREIAVKWSMARSDARARARKLTAQGYLEQSLRSGPVPQKSSYYRAGPVIKQELGYE